MRPYGVKSCEECEFVDNRQVILGNHCYGCPKEKKKKEKKKKKIIKAVKKGFGKLRKYFDGLESFWDD